MLGSLFLYPGVLSAVDTMDTNETSFYLQTTVYDTDHNTHRIISETIFI